MPSATKALNELKRFYLSSHPQALAALNPSASMTAIQTLEKKVRKALPSDFLACYQMHDGQSDGEFTFLAGHKWLSLHEISMDWSAWERLLLDGDLDDTPSRPDHQIQAGWWRSGWIPFTSDGGGTHLCLDLDPAEGGEYGQVIKVYHDMPHRQYLAADFGDWLARQVTSIINDR